MRTRFFDILYWLVILIWFAANAAVLVTTKRPRVDRYFLLIWAVVAYSLWRRWRRAQGRQGTSEAEDVDS